MIILTWKDWNCKFMMNPVGAIISQVSFVLIGYEFGLFGLIMWVLVQQSISESKPREAGQLFDPHTRSSWHSSFKVQCPSFSEQVLQ